MLYWKRLTGPEKAPFVLPGGVHQGTGRSEGWFINTYWAGIDQRHRQMTGDQSDIKAKVAIGPLKASTSPQPPPCLLSHPSGREIIFTGSKKKKKYFLGSEREKHKDAEISVWFWIKLAIKKIKYGKIFLMDFMTLKYSKRFLFKRMNKKVNFYWKKAKNRYNLEQ